MGRSVDGVDDTFDEVLLGLIQRFEFLQIQPVPSRFRKASTLAIWPLATQLVKLFAGGQAMRVIGLGSKNGGRRCWWR